MPAQIPALGAFSTGGVDSDFNLGEDASTVTLTDDQGNAYNLGKVLDVHPQFKQTEVNIAVLNQGGRELTQTERYGGTIDFTIARSDGTMEKLEYIQQQRKRQKLRELYFTVYEFINNPDGSQNENMYTKCRVHLQDGGQRKLGQAIEQKVHVIFTDFVQVS